ncbi:translation initiation factor IF-2 [Candidatus Uhrbacteria bacterium]|nr:translation initiation factor IF-2 [Candidatus Uhrbacteria bacterium]
MNISELARKLKITTSQLHEVLPQMGFDVGQRAIKIDDSLASKIIKNWSQYQHLLIKKSPDVQEQTSAPEPTVKPRVELSAVITVRDFAVALNIPVTKLIKTLMNNGILAALNEKIDYDTAAIIAEDLGFVPEKKQEEEGGEDFITLADPIKEVLAAEKKESLIHRPPVTVIMGHVDHGKTTLLDKIRSANVIASESGGITQHIGAYQVTKKRKGTNEDHIITFIDTPGHEAFTTMRSRGAKIADIAILVVAADDGVKPQTVEAIKIIKAAGIPLLVAINKIDKPDANLERVKRELSDHGLIPEDWGGKTTCVGVSAKEGTGIDDLLDMILLVADMEKEKILAHPKGTTVGTVIESHIDKNEGPVATILVQNGQLSQNDHLVIDNIYYGKVRAMKDHLGKSLAHALPSQPVKIIGFKQAPVVGYIVFGMKTLPKTVEKEGRKISSGAVVVSPRAESRKEGEKAVNLILKTDTLGSLEAIANALFKIDNPEVKVKIISKDLGAVTSADVLRAEATKAFIAGFHVTATSSAAQLASEKNVEIKIYKIIYELLDDVKTRIEELLAPEISRTVLGSVKILAVFRTESNAQIVGGVVLEGTLEPKNKVHIVRNDMVVTEAKIARLQSGKQEIPRAESGQEIGMRLEGRPLAQVGDIVRAYKEEKIQRTLE